MWKQLKRKPLGLLGAVIIVIVMFTALFAHWIAPYDPYKIDLKARLQPPSFQHFFGTDKLGRDILSRVIYGTRISLQISSIVVALAFPIGTIIGAFSGFAGGLVDEVLMRITDVFLSIPGLVLAMAIAAALGPSIQNVILALAVIWWTWYARLSRSSVLQIKEFEYVEAAKAIGNSNIRLIFRHILPNCLGPVMVNATLDFGFVTLSAAGLSFIGLGAQPPSAEWGAMLSQSREILREAWWATMFPGFAILFTVLGFNLLGDALRDIFDPRLKQ